MTEPEARAAALRNHQAGQLEQALLLYEVLLEQLPGDGWSLKMSGLALLQGGDPDRAGRRLAAALEVTDEADTWLYLASARQAAGQYAAAAEALAQARQRHGESPDLFNSLGALSQHTGDPVTAAQHYAKALQMAPNRPALAANLAAAQAQCGAMREALDNAQLALRLDPQLGPAWKILGSARAALGDPEGARAALERAVEQSPADPDASYQLGVVLDEQGRWDEAAIQHDRALRLNPQFGPSLSEALFLRQRLCQWDDLEALQLRFDRAVAAGQAGLKPFSWLSAPTTAAQQLACARLWSRQIAARVRPLAPRPPRTDPPIRVGYLSSGFHQHPTACLTAEYFERLERSASRTLLYSVGPDDGSQLRTRLRQAADQFHDLSGRSFAHIARHIADDGVDVLVDLRGYGGGAVSEVLAMRAAPIQVNWLAYPGTMGADFMDYIVLDPFVATPQVLAGLVEQPVILPHSYQPTDTTRAIPDLGLRRADEGLPENAMVYCCFNNSYKFSPAVFERWMAILSAVPGSVLWLLAGRAGTSTDDNLRQSARRAGVAPERLIFMAKRPHAQYLARYRLADLFLDSWPYNAHTTASDALWAGCPVLTCSGQTFASRVAGSLARSAGLAQLVTQDPDQYQQLATAIGQDRQQAAALRRQLLDHRSQAPLFNTAAFCGHMQRAFALMVERARAGQPPAPLTVPEQKMGSE